MTKKIEDIEDRFSPGNDWYGSFECPNCNQNWGPSNDGDPPADMWEKVKCTCGAILDVNCEWVSEYSIDVDMVE